MGNLGVLIEDEGRAALSSQGREFVIAFWEFAAFIANSLVFLLIGLRVAAGMRAELPAGHRTSRDQDRYVMIEITLSTATQRRPFLPFLPLTVSQRRRRSLDDAAPTSCDRRRHAKPDPPADGAGAPRPVNPSDCRASGR